MKCFTVQSKDLFDEKKNPGLKLSAESIMKNKKIPKKFYEVAKTIKSKIRNPQTKKLLNRVFIKNKGFFGWNTVYKVYNNDGDYSQLNNQDIKNIDYTKSE